MITPKEIETKQFTSTKGGGYKGDEVDQFLDEILVDYTRLLEERNALKNKVNLLTEKLNTLASAPAPAPAPEPAPAPAPVVINQAPSEELEAARKKAARLVADAEDYAKKLIETAQYEANRQNSVAQKLAAEIEAFRNSLMDTYSAHIKMVEAIPTMQYEDVKIGSDTLDILNQSFNDAAPAPAPAPVEAPAPAPAAEDFEIPTRVPATDTPAAVAFDETLLEDVTKKRPAKASGKGLEDLFDDESSKGKKKDTKKKKKKLFFRDEDDDDDDDFFDDDDE